jgi:hypothetical protein
VTPEESKKLRLGAAYACALLCKDEGMFERIATAPCMGLGLSSREAVAFFRVIQSEYRQKTPGRAPDRPDDGEIA